MNGLSIKSTNFWDVSTLPPTTAALIDGCNIEYSGMINFIGTKHPEFNGIYLPNKDRKQYNTALLVIDLGALVLPITYGPVPVKSNIAYFLFLSIVNFKQMGVPSSIYYVFYMEYTYGKLLVYENLYNIYSTDYLAFIQTKLTYFLNSLTPFSFINIFSNLIPI